MSQVIIDTETQIKLAAKKVFLCKGLAGTRLQEIADEAGIGRTALHYYFRSKEKLFEVVWKEVFGHASEMVNIFEDSEMSIVQKMQAFAANHFDKALIEPELGIFILNEFNNNPDLMASILFSDHLKKSPTSFLDELDEAIKNGEIVGESKQILITLLSICIFPFAGKSMLQKVLNTSEGDYLKLLKDRKEYVMNFLETAFNK